jgi:Fic family protein
VKPYIPQKLPLDSVDWDELVPAIGEASFELGRYSGALDALGAPSVYFLPIATQEAVYSSRVEGTRSTYEDVVGGQALADLDPRTREDIEEVMNYRRAMLHALERLKERPLNLNMLKEMHAILLENVRGRDKGRGQFRRVQNWIGGATMSTARYVPPPVEVLDDCLANWERYLHARRPDEVEEPHLMSERDPLVQLAILHAQFEIIHPFVDGNGRVGRMIIPLFLYQRGLIAQPVFAISPYIDAHRSEYFDRLGAISEQGDWSGWILFFLRAVRHQAIENKARARKIVDLYSAIKERVRRRTRSQYASAAVEIIFEEPIFRTSGFVQRLAAPRRSGLNILDTLKEIGVLKVIQSGSGPLPDVLGFSELLEVMR